MSEFKRVRDRSTGHKLTVVASAAESQPAFQVLDAPAVDANDRPLPPEFAAPKSLSSESTGPKATTEKKEAAR